MISIIDKFTNENFINRVNNLTPDSKPLWGRMNVIKMLGHVSISIQAAIGEIKVKRVFMGYLIGALAKKIVLKDEKPFKKGAPTSPEYIANDKGNFEEEKLKLTGYIKMISEKGEPGFTKNPHPFFGCLTPSEWDRLMYKHLDHHLRQFGV